MSRGWHAIYLPHAEDHLQSVHGHRRCRGVPEKWSLSYWNDDIANVVMRGMQGADALLLGGVTHEGFAEAWSDRTVEDDPGADFMNNVQKYVMSRTLTKVDWNNSALLEGELADSVRELKESAGGEIAMSGSSTLVRSLLYLKLLDELNLLVHPVIVGRGKRHAEGDGDQRFGSPRLLTPPGRMWPGDGTENPGHSPRVSDE